MPKVITDQQTRDICRMINTWDTQHKLDWNTICLGAQEILGWTTPPTRQALNKKTTIKLAYQAKKDALRREIERVQNLPRPKTIQDGAERIARLEKEIERLNTVNNQFAEIIRTIIHNATLAGLKKQDVMKPIQTIKK
ncbi:hypothetical protein [Pseudomonas asiatica]|uniref:hypothetical protein n=1 Tax=Pseudomonas asiatica TaxID=2219225 RepID=UPI000C243716|nr:MULTISPECIES: hypothetical protein [Pseudomonas]CAB5599431.1 Uncharacterised protein [Pseudomonas putida]MBO2921831.1 hypothetical protein [Pseudomonas asiatica]PJI70600.1 hypothetical protein CSW00_28080 [Pseudomonas sp. MR 02]WPU59752.1 hypothetical protein SQW15_24180 [Pseudomonas asiatica]CAB5659060.1 Uncharacterised protein [Pseudomonas putida]